jgi:hypothetical protein
MAEAYTDLGHGSRAAQWSITGIYRRLAWASCVADDDCPCASATALITKYNGAIHGALGDGSKCKRAAIGSNVNVFAWVVGP